MCQNRAVSPKDMPTNSNAIVKNRVRRDGITKPAKAIRYKLNTFDNILHTFNIRRGEDCMGSSEMS